MPDVKTIHKAERELHVINLCGFVTMNDPLHVIISAIIHIHTFISAALRKLFICVTLHQLLTKHKPQTMFQPI